jgi:predicted nucleic acid-binding protein
VTVTSGPEPGRLLLDAGVWIGARQPGSPHHEVCRSLVVDPEIPVGALELTMYEVGNVLGARDGHPDAAVDMCRLISGRCGDAIVSVDPLLIRSALGIARSNRLSAYDASYVAAARREGWTLVSLDLRDLVSKGLAITPDAAV